MGAILPSVRWRVELQGFVGLDDGTVCRIDHGLRFSPLVCAVITALGTAFGSSGVLWCLLPFAAAGAALGQQPLDAIHDHGLRYLTGGAPIPRYPPPRRFACALASAWLIATALCFDLGAVTPGWILGWSMVAVASINVAFGFCIPSFLFRLATGTYSRARASGGAGGHDQPARY